MHDPLLIFAAIAVVVAIPIVLWVRARRVAAWRQSLDSAAEKYGLRHARAGASLSPYLDTASGRFDSMGVLIGTEQESTGFGETYSESRYLKIEISGSFDWGLEIVSRRELRRRAAYSVGDPQKAETPSGDPAFDKRVAMFGASPELCDAVRSADLRHLIEEAMEHGLHVEARRVVILTARVPLRPTPVLDQVERALDLCRQIDRLQHART